MDKLLAAASMSNSKNDIVELLPHNQMLYDKIVAEMERGEFNIFYSEATGLGKSFIFMRLVQDYFKGKKILYIVPKIAIWKNLIRYKEFNYLDADIIMTTYAAFNKYDSNLCDEYDVVFVDECHHMLSEIQGNNVQQFCKDMTAFGKYSFGFTATPYYKGVYVDEACFDVSCYGYDVCEAIDLGLLPRIHFSVANIDIDSIPMDMKARYSITGTKTLLEQLLMCNERKHRWIAYFLNKTELEQNVHELETLFPDYTILKVYDGVEDEDAIYDTFNNSTGKVILLSVNKLLEGVHLKNVQGILLYRNVIEFSTYMQMYGRLCDISAKESPIFLDVANAVFGINKVSEVDIFKSNRCESKPKRKLRDFFDVHAEDYWTVELMDVLRMKNSNNFTEEEDTILKDNASICTLSELCKLVPNHSPGGVQHRLRILGLTCVPRSRISEDDIEVIKTYYVQEGTKCRLRLSKDYSAAYVAHIASQLGLKYDNPDTWEDEDIQNLIKLRNSGMSNKELCEALGRSMGSVTKAVARYCEVKRTTRRLSDKEKEVINQCVLEHLTYVETTERINQLPENLDSPRSTATIRDYTRKTFGSQRKIYLMSEEDVEWLRLNSSNYTIAEMIDLKFPNINEGTLIQRIHREGLEYKRTKNYGYDKEHAEQYILDHYTTETAKEMANTLDLGESTVQSIMGRLNIKSPRCTPWSKDDLETAIRMRNEGATYVEIGKCLGRHRDSVSNKLKRNPSVIEQAVETYRGVILNSMHSITKQFGVSYSFCAFYKQKTTDYTLKGFVDYLYNYLIDKGIAATEDDVYAIVQKNKDFYNI